MGTFAIQIAKAHGAEVTAVDGPGKLDVCHRSPADYRRALRPGGFCGVVGGSAGRLVEVTILGQTLRRSAGRRVSLVMYRANRPEDVALLVRMLAEGAVVPMIDRVFPLGEGVQAMRHYLSGEFAGKVVVTM